MTDPESSVGDWHMTSEHRLGPRLVGQALTLAVGEHTVRITADEDETYGVLQNARCHLDGRAVDEGGVSERLQDLLRSLCQDNGRPPNAVGLCSLLAPTKTRAQLEEESAYELNAFHFARYL